MPKIRLTSAAVERFPPPPSGQMEYYDTHLPAYGVRVSYSGAKAWFLMTRVDRRLTRVTLGRYPAVSLAEARELARATATHARAGRDPRRIRADERLENERVARADTRGDRLDQGGPDACRARCHPGRCRRRGRAARRERRARRIRRAANGRALSRHQLHRSPYRRAAGSSAERPGRELFRACPGSSRRGVEAATCAQALRGALGEPSPGVSDSIKSRTRLSLTR